MTWEGLRHLRIRRRVPDPDCPGVTSLHLVDASGRPLPPFLPGQYLTFDLDIPGHGRPVVACYSLSSAPGGDDWRITVKALEGGRSSPYLALRAREGDLLRARAPIGRFTLDPRGADPAVLVGGGIGVTPLMSMLHAAAAADARDVIEDPTSPRGGASSISSPRAESSRRADIIEDPTSPRGGTSSISSRAESSRRADIIVVLGMRHGAEWPLRREVEALARASKRITLHVRLSRPRAEDAWPAGHVSAETLFEVVPPADRPYAFYVCGPPAMMADVTAGLRRLGVPESQVRVEAFGTASTRRLRAVAPPVATAGDTPLVTFARAGKTVPWDPAAETLLGLAEKAHVPIPYACGVGRCGTCMTRLSAGAVRYPVEPSFRIHPGFCLPCVGLPDGPVTLDT
jgi:uncharacterized protein